jgi:hypothetical protein
LRRHGRCSLGSAHTDCTEALSRHPVLSVAPARSAAATLREWSFGSRPRRCRVDRGRGRGASVPRGGAMGVERPGPGPGAPRRTASQGPPSRSAALDLTRASQCGYSSLTSLPRVERRGVLNILGLVGSGLLWSTFSAALAGFCRGEGPGRGPMRELSFRVSSRGMNVTRVPGTDLGGIPRCISGLMHLSLSLSLLCLQPNR